MTSEILLQTDEKQQSCLLKWQSLVERKVCPVKGANQESFKHD